MTYSRFTARQIRLPRTATTAACVWTLRQSFPYVVAASLGFWALLALLILKVGF